MAKFHLILFISCCLLAALVDSATFTLENKCDYVVWPGILSGAGTAPLSTTGFALQKGETKSVDVPGSWSGRLWGRTLCTEDSATGVFSCVTADCGSGKLECSGAGASPPATLAEFTLNGYGGQDFYDVSLVDGYNLPMIVSPQGGTGVNCTITGCIVDLNGACPADLRVLSSDGGGESVACKSACEAFATPEYCCSGEYGSPDTCKPSSYSEIFKTACPHAYSYAYDDKSSTFICGSAPDYLITFCPAPSTSKKASKENTTSPATDEQPLVKGTMVYEGAEFSASNALPSMCNHVFRCSHIVVGGFSILAATWRLSSLLLNSF